jgi:hypothetical protein
MAVVGFLLLLVANVLCIQAARFIATSKGWRTYGWMLAAALLGPPPVMLMVLIPRQRPMAS